MTIREIQHIIESWAPREIAWERDNVGLQIGSVNQSVRRILVTIDVTNEVIQEAKRKKVNLIISHHPLFFHPAKSIDFDQRTGWVAAQLIKLGIGLYSAHTNLDFARYGVSFALAERLGLHHINILLKNQKIQKKITVFVPLDYVEKVINAMAKAGAGSIGKYECCSFGTEGVGTFKPTTEAKPFIGNAGILERVREIRLEMIVPSWKIESVISAMRSAHPYEDVAYDVYDLANTSADYGAGAIGDLYREMSLQQFLKIAASALNSSILKYSNSTKRKIRRVAVCGGGGIEIVNSAISQSADAFITADISYHHFFENSNQIVLIDAGHFETEYPVLKNIVKHLHTEIVKRTKTKIEIYAASTKNNPIQYYLP